MYLSGLSIILAVELGVHGITVNAYAPGLIDTAMCACHHRTFSFTTYSAYVLNERSDGA